MADVILKYMRLCFVVMLVYFTIITVQAQVINSVRMAESIIRHNPSPNTLDGGKTLRWGYTQGLLCKSLIELSDFNGNKEFYKYAASYVDSIVNEDGTIKTYTLTDYNIDQLNGGKILFQLYKDTHKEKYANAIKMLRSQMLNHPRTAEGGFWHKKVYPHQMWLDGLYMGSPFLAQYAKEFNESALFEDVINQFVLIDKHSYDPVTGLYYHGWDESREQKWANKINGTSPNFWGRSVGWYAMALVDAMDFIPSDHKYRSKMIEIMYKVANGIAKNQDKDTGLWFQVLDKKGEPGNYLESTASSMFVYFLLKAVNNKYIDAKYLDVAKKGYSGILQTFIKNNDDGTISITNCCSVVGLGGSPNYRDGSYGYYVGEKVVNDDLKAIGPFILAGIELEKIK